MSCVLTKLFSYKVRNDEYQLKSYALDDRFYLDMKKYNTVSCWRNDVKMDFSVAQAKVLKGQLEEFIAQNNG